MPFVSSVRGNFGPQRRGRIAGDPLNKFGITGGTITTAGGYRIHTFTTAGSDSFNTTPWGTTINVEYLVIGGGGGSWNIAGGGGAGGYLSGTTSVSAATYPITVGAGGPGGPVSSYGFPSNDAIPGQNSSFGNIVSIGGGSGGRYPDRLTGASPKINGGSGGGGSGHSCGGGGGAGSAGQAVGPGSPATAFGSGTPGQGNPGGRGTDIYPNGPGNGNGGAGVSSSITGTPVGRAGGGGGGHHGPGSSYVSNSGGSATDGGGARSSTTSSNATPGTANTGGGGGGGAHAPGESPSAGSGGTGLVVIRYLL